MTSVRYQKLWTSPFYGSKNNPSLKTLHMPHINRESLIHKCWFFQKRELFSIKYIFCMELHRIKERERNTILFAMHKNCRVFFFLHVVDYCILEGKRLLVWNHHWWNNVRAEIYLKKIASNTSLAKFLIIHSLRSWSMSYLIIS